MATHITLNLTKSQVSNVEILKNKILEIAKKLYFNLLELESIIDIESGPIMQMFTWKVTHSNKKINTELCLIIEYLDLDNDDANYYLRMPCCSFILEEVSLVYEKQEQSRNLLKLDLFKEIAKFFEVDEKEVIIER